MEKTKDLTTKEVEKKSRKRGPKTIIVEDLIQAKGDPLSLNLIEETDDLTHLGGQAKIKSKTDIVVERYNPDPKVGLTIDDVERRMMAGLNNVTEVGSTKSILRIFLSNGFTFFNLLNLLIAVWLISAKAPIQNLHFLVVAVANFTIGIIQEIKAKQTIDKLSLLSAPTALVIRDGEHNEINVNEVVIDDILHLTVGKQISTDAVLRSGMVEVDESLLTGESDAIVKKEGDTLYSGSYVVSGDGYAQTTSVGKDIYVQKLTSQAKNYNKPQSELLGSLKIVIRAIGIFVIPPIAATLYYIMTAKYLNNPGGVEMTYLDIVVSTTGAMIGMIPSGLFLLTSMALAVGVIRLGEHNALVQELYCIEMLARVDTLCLDKTGTITDGTMSVKSVIEYKNDTGLSLKNIVSASINAQKDTNSTSQALIDRFGTSKRIRHSDIIPFSSARKFSATTFDKYGTFAIGAPEFVLKNDYHLVEEEVEKQANQGYRVLVIAHSPNGIKDDKIAGKLKPIALIMIEDTIRPDAIETIEYFKQYGVDVKVISGDNALTVSRISQRAGIENADQYISLDGMQDKDVVRAASRYQVFGRVNPHQKKVLVEALKNNGRTVAMTGDGVNDILALQVADTSIAMASGSEAARNVSHLVLLDSNFSSMPKVVAEGRRVINNVQRVSTLFLTKTFFSLFLAIMAIMRQGIYPIQPKQLILIDFLVTGIPSFLLALEANNSKIEGNFLWNIIKSALPGALVVTINTLIIFGFEKPLGMDKQTTSTLIVLLATIASLMVLYRVSRPLNKRRTILLSLMVSSFLLAILFVPYFFEFNPLYNMKVSGGGAPLTLPQILLLIVLTQATLPMMYILSNLYGWIKTAVQKILKTVADIQ